MVNFTTKIEIYKYALDNVLEKNAYYGANITLENLEKKQIYSNPSHPHQLESLAQNIEACPEIELHKGTEIITIPSPKTTPTKESYIYYPLTAQELNEFKIRYNNIKYLRESQQKNNI
jgi:hypothetical protein